MTLTRVMYCLAVLAWIVMVGSFSVATLANPKFISFIEKLETAGDGLTYLIVVLGFIAVKLIALVWGVQVLTWMFAAADRRHIDTELTRDWRRG